MLGGDIVAVVACLKGIMRMSSVTGLFFSIFLIGFYVCTDFGISCDEPYSRLNGLVSLNHLASIMGFCVPPGDEVMTQGNLSLNSNISLNNYVDRDYGVAFELFVCFLERYLHISDSRNVFIFRHLMTFAGFMLGVWAVFRLAERRYSDWRVGLFVVLCLVLSPRIFAEAFYNSKDVIFMSLFAVAINTLVPFVLKPNFRTCFFHSLATAVAIDVRIMAVCVPLATLVFLPLRAYKSTVAFKRIALWMMIYTMLMAIFVVALWPWLWSDPLGNFVIAFSNMSKFRWEGEVLYLGSQISASVLPWHYIPVWIFITTPPVYSCLWLVGLLNIFRMFLRCNLRVILSDDNFQDLIFCVFFLGPLGAIIFFRSVLYDGWRQMYFVYPLFLLIATNGFLLFVRSIAFGRIARIVAVASVSTSFILSAKWMVRAHPFQNVYFNVFAGTGLTARFDVDYWALTGTSVLQYILAHDKRAEIKVWPLSRYTFLYTFMIDAHDRKRIVLSADESGADYLITTYRLDKANHATRTDIFLFYQIQVAEEVIVSVYKRIRNDNCCLSPREKFVSGQAAQGVLFPRLPLPE